MDLKMVKHTLENSLSHKERLTMAKKCKVKGIPWAWISSWIESPSGDLRLAAVNACVERDKLHNKELLLKVIEVGLIDTNIITSNTAAELCLNINIPYSKVAEWQDSGLFFKRLAAMYACVGRLDAPVSYIEKGLHDTDVRVRRAAAMARETRRYKPLVRTFEPPNVVYKKCVGTMVVAGIPEDAQVRGDPKGKCRANKAVILDIVGDIWGEKIGIPLGEPEMLYRINDQILTIDFDYGLGVENKPGFTFYCTERLAQNS